MAKFNRNERGQVLILLVLGVVGLLAFSALAIDGGMLYSDRRYDQSVADSAALGGAAAGITVYSSGTVTYDEWDCSTNGNTAMSLAYNKAVAIAAQNGYTLQDNRSHTLGQDVSWVDVRCLDSAMGAYHDRYIEVKVHVVSETKTNFAHLVFGGTLKNQVDAISNFRPAAAAAYGYTIVALHDSCPNQNTGGINFDGNITTTIDHGGLFSFACIRRGGGGVVTTNDATDGNHMVTTYTSNGGGSITPTPTRTSALPEIEIPAPKCSGVATAPARTGAGTAGNPYVYSPGRYTAVIDINNNTYYQLTSGLYCLNGGINLNGGKLDGAAVTLYFESGGYDSNGTPEVHLTAPFTKPYPAGTVPGVLMYYPTSNTSQVDIQGKSNSTFAGTIYAPSSQIDIGGTAANSTPDQMSVQIIGDLVKVHGNVRLTASLDKQHVFINPAWMFLKR